MQQSDFLFTPRVVAAHTGDSLSIANVSPSSPHTFTISSKGINVVNDPGQAQSITIRLAPGTYPFVCTFHQALGMTGTLVVTAPGTAPPRAALAAVAGAQSSPGPSPRAGPSSAGPATGAPPAAAGQPPQAGSGGRQSEAAARARGSHGPLGLLVLVGGLLALAAGSGWLALNLRSRARARSGG